MEKLQQTKNYGQFVFSKENRKVDMHSLSPDHKRLLDDMTKNGFRPACPIMVRHDGTGTFIIMDGQHRYTFAKHLGLPVYFVVDHTPIDIAEFQRTQSAWRNDDYAHRWASLGDSDYQEGVEFAEQFDIPLPSAFALLAGTICFTNINAAFHSGQFEIKDREFAYSVGRLYRSLTSISKKLKKILVLKAVYKCMRVEGFDAARLLKGAERKIDSMRRPATEKDALDLLEELYNFGRGNRVPLAHIATETSRRRKATFGKSSKIAGDLSL